MVCSWKKSPRRCQIRPAMPTAIEPQPTARPIPRASLCRQPIAPVPSPPLSAGLEPPSAIASSNRNVAATEKKIGIHSARYSKALTACAREMSTARKAILATRNHSTQSRGLAHHWSPRSRRCMDLAPRVLVPAGRLGCRGSRILPQIGGRFLELGQLGDDFVVAVPLDKVGPTHVRAVLGGAAAVMPEVEVQVLDRLVERLLRQQLVLAELLDDVLGLVDDLVGGPDHAFGFAVELENPGVGVAFQADGLHVPPAALVIRPAVGNRGEEVIRQTLRRVVRGLDVVGTAPFQSTQVARG